MRLHCWKMASYGNWIPPRRISDYFLCPCHFEILFRKNVIFGMPRRAALFRSSISWSEKIWAQVLISCQVSALLIIWGLREAKRVREILIHRVLQPRKSSFPTPDKNSWNHRSQLKLFMISQKIPTGQFFGKTRSRILQVKSQVMQFWQMCISQKFF